MGKIVLKFEISHPYLYAWDRLLGSSLGWSESMQAKAREENAPHDAIYRKKDGTWATFGHIESPLTRNYIETYVANLEKRREK